MTMQGKGFGLGEASWSPLVLFFIKWNDMQLFYVVRGKKSKMSVSSLFCLFLFVQGNLKSWNRAITLYCNVKIKVEVLKVASNWKTKLENILCSYVDITQILV
jgi:hypothetical protein